uniref:hypothetical protein n=1 Tax=Streptomyces corallincola TaxID=2851888 RepID=UPI003FD79E02
MTTNIAPHVTVIGAVLGGLTLVTDRFRALILEGRQALRVVDRHANVLLDQPDDGTGGNPEALRGELRRMVKAISRATGDRSTGAILQSGVDMRVRGGSSGCKLPG